MFLRFLTGFGQHLGFQIDAKINEKMYQKTHPFLEVFLYKMQPKWMPGGAQMETKMKEFRGHFATPSQEPKMKESILVAHEEAVFLFRGERRAPTGGRGGGEIWNGTQGRQPMPNPVSPKIP